MNAPTSPPEDGGAGSAEIVRRGRLAMLILGARAAVLQVLVLVAGVVLARLLDPKDFGVVAIVQTALAFFAIVGDGGLGAALIQQKDEPTDEQLASVFYAQLALGLVVVAGVFVAAPYVVARYPSLPPSAVLLLRALSVTFLLGMARAVPSIKLERQLAFGKLALVDVIGQLSFYVTVVPFAALGFHELSLVVGAIASALAGLVTVYALAPYRPRGGLVRGTLGPLFTFGLPFQLKSALSFLNASVTAMYGGVVLGSARVGLVQKGQETAYFPLKLVEIVGRVGFPLYARMRDDPATLSREMTKHVRVCAYGTLYFGSLVLALGPELLRVLFGPKWVPATPALQVFSAALVVGFVSPIVGAALDALGRPGIFVRLSVVWTTVSWAAVLLTVPLWPDGERVLGFSIAYASHVVIGNVLVIVVAKRILPDVRVVSTIARPLVPAVVAGLVGRRFLAPFVAEPLTLALGVLAMAALFAIGAVLFDRSGAEEVFAFAVKKREGSAA